MRGVVKNRDRISWGGWIRGTAKEAGCIPGWNQQIWRRSGSSALSGLRILQAIRIHFTHAASKCESSAAEIWLREAWLTQNTPSLALMGAQIFLYPLLIVYLHLFQLSLPCKPVHLRLPKKKKTFSKLTLGSFSGDYTRKGWVIPALMETSVKAKLKPHKPNSRAIQIRLLYCHVACRWLPTSRLSGAGFHFVPDFLHHPFVYQGDLLISCANHSWSK